PVRENIIRPLIGITREEVETYCEFYGLSYVTDSSNLTDHYARNKIRHSVVPVLKEINPAFEANVLAMTEHLREDEAWFEEKAHVGLAAAKCRGGYRLSGLNAMPRPVLMRAIAIAAGETAKARLESRHLYAVEEIIRRPGGSVTVAGGIQFTVQGNTVFIAKNEPAAQWSEPLNPAGTVLPDGRVLQVKKLCRKEYEKRCEIHNLLFNNLINYDTILGITYVRNRRSGDLFRPAGRGVTKSLKKLFNEAKLEPILRSRAVMLECDGTILWIEGFGASQDACVTNDTQNIAEIIIKEC
ncbi:MAG TPA: tRNA lysidine(34) synthetase TilS, partial [Caproiciproducens sp.]|nr:tRNA lysidine(34) synthetase TilS [Caproiciproducens sp.]